MNESSSPGTPTDDVLARLVADRFGLSGTITPLPGERDRNLRLDTEEGASWVIKATAPEESDATLEFEAGLLGFLAGGDGVRVPAQRPADDGSVVVRNPGDGAGGAPVRLRVLELLPGGTLASVRARSDDLLADVGRTLARLHRTLVDYPDRPPARPDFDWSLDRTEAVIERGREVVDATRRPVLVRALDRFRAAASARAALPRQLVHGDLNDHNVLVSPPDPERAPAGRHVTGVVDFGDVHEAPAVHDLAVAAAYAVLGRADPLQAAARVVAGYHDVRSLGEDEAAQLVPLMCARLAVSVSMAAWRRRGAAEVDPYLLVSEAPAWAALEALDGVPDAIAEGVVREACGFEPCARSSAVRAWLAGLDAPPMVDGLGVTVLDLSVGSPLLDGRDTDDTAAFSRRTFAAMEGAGAEVGVGRYGEPRAFYLTDAFAGRPAEPPERRTVHLGVDLFAVAGTAVRAPLDGRVVSIRDNEERLDYGPTVILEHDSPHGPFWTLYGHLERASVAELAVGDRIEAGRSFVRIGPFPENGDWPPHLHVQVLLDRMGHAGTFPGVAAPRERSVWMSFCPDPTPLTGFDVFGAWHAPDGTDILASRRRHLPRNLGLSYRTPLHVVRGRGAYLYDVLGREWLDGVNNVAHVGHEHPRVVEALVRQAKVLNTNTRYLHASVVRYAERLTSLFPEPLSVCFLVNSGSEANELALRLARAHTGRRGVVVLEGGYHGHTGTLVDASHYKHAGPGGRGAPPWIRAAAMPDEYRGAHRRDDPDRVGRYAASVARAAAELVDTTYGVAAFLAEPILSCGGQIVPPDGYLARAYEAAREAGAVVIADEIQTGFGRVGSHLWAFEALGGVPDIVTLGKPIGNGHPMGAVVTTAEIADAVGGGMEFFSTFGGNPVSAEVGLAVLDVLEDEGLQAQAHRVGRELMDGLAGLATDHPVVGDVRGRGLFLGVEFIAPGAGGHRAADGSDGPGPAPRIAHYVVERAKARGVLLSTDGPDENVVKIKPPMPFTSDDAGRLLDAVAKALDEDALPFLR